MAGTDPTGQFANILGGAVVGAFIGVVAAAINGEDVLAGAAKGAVVGAVAGATFGAGLAAAGAVTASSVVAAGTVSGMAGATAAAVVYEGRAPTGQELAWGGILGGVTAGILPAASSFGRFLGRSAIAGRRAPLARPIARPGTACFLAGTLVLTAAPALAVPIESIAEGAVVASVDPATGDPVPAVVTATPVTLFEGTIYDITVDPGEPGGGDETVSHETTISATGEHPFLVARAGARATSLESRADPEAVALVEPLDTVDGRWVPARDLAEGDTVRTMSAAGVAGTATVAKIRARHAVAPVYNLTVRGTSRYLVGACGVVVHNKGEGAGSGGSRFVGPVRVVDRRTGKVFEGTVDLKPTLDRIRQGVRDPHRNDGEIFMNDRGLLPAKPNGYYREFVHRTPGIDHVGPQRVVIGRGGEVYYTPDHYDSFIPVCLPGR
jgi:hypothetical protein